LRSSISWPQAVVFDLDGTLADTADDIHQALNHVFEANTLASLDVAAVRQMIGGGPRTLIRKTLCELSIEPDTDRVDRLSREFLISYVQQQNRFSTLYGGAEACLEELASAGVRLAICSNKPDEFCRQLTADLGIFDRFHVIKGSVAGMPLKPDPAMLNVVLNQLGASRDEVLYVGDSETDVRVARAAGVSVALVKGGYTTTPVDELGADWLVESLAGIPHLCRKYEIA